jgi:dolichol-phosphate mannosyltransferase
MMKMLTAIPVYNEEKHLDQVLGEVRRYSEDILVVNDGSMDRTPEILAQHRDLHLIAHPVNRGYGAALISAMGYASAHHYDVLVTMDCDGQHEPARIPVLMEAMNDGVDIVSGSRYLRTFKSNTTPPRDRQRINHQITAELNARFGLNLTDSFCGFKAYRVSRLAALDLTETGYGMPLQLWVQAARLGLRIVEVAIPLLYLDFQRAFGGVLDNPGQRLAHYHDVIEREVARQECCLRGVCH